MSCCTAVFAVAHVGSTQDTDERNAHVNQVSTFLTAAANAGHAHRVMPHIAPWVAHSYTGVRSLAVQALHSVAKTTKHSSQPVASTVTHERRLADVKSTEDAGLVLARLIADRSMDLATRVAALEGFHSWRSMKPEALDTLQQALLVELEVRRRAQRWGCSAAPDLTSPLNTCLLSCLSQTSHPRHCEETCTNEECAVIETANMAACRQHCTARCHQHKRFVGMLVGLLSKYGNVDTQWVLYDLGIGPQPDSERPASPEDGYEPHAVSHTKVSSTVISPRACVHAQP